MSFLSDITEDLVLYAEAKMHLLIEDAMFARNALLDFFKTEVSDGYKPHIVKDLQEEILNPLLAYAVENGLIEKWQEIAFETKVMGFVTPSPGLVVTNYKAIRKEKGAEAAAKYLYEISVRSNYIRTCDIKKNIRWFAEGDKGKIGITINLSKPEKDAKQVLAEKNFTGKKYPKCLLCLENIGFAGSPVHPSRQTLRCVPMVLNYEMWHLQFSPYVYYDEHCIAFSDGHAPMKLTNRTFNRLLDFVDLFPHYFMGSNADLPIVGGSILAHEHYQGGKKVLPMFASKDRQVIINSGDLSLSILDWYNSVITVRGKNKKAVSDACASVLSAWRKYSDESVNILSETSGVAHNTITPIAHKEGLEYAVDLILRNNRTDELHPDGIFHPTQDMHNIKKEGIGLIEAMGLFILPGRLKTELAKIAELIEKGDIDFDAVKRDEALSKHINLISDVSKDYKKGEAASELVTAKVNSVCLKILECTAVFKNTKEGQNAFLKFAKVAVKKI